VAERVCYGLTAVFFATFLQATYHLSLSEVAVPLAVFALGSIWGPSLGGQLADRLPTGSSPSPARCSARPGSPSPCSAGRGPASPAPVALGFGYVFVNAIARPSLMAALADVPDGVAARCWASTSPREPGLARAAALGGWMLAQHGFAGFGPLAAGVAALGGALALAGRR
jgi:predicted MFS family arabinose efflux permease